MNPNGLLLAIDQSTSSTKALLFTTDGKLLDQELFSHDQIYPRAGWVELPGRQGSPRRRTTVSRSVRGRILRPAGRPRPTTSAGPAGRPPRPLQPASPRPGPLGAPWRGRVRGRGA